MDDVMRIIATGYDHAEVTSAIFEQQTKIVQVTIVKFCLVVPFDLDTNTVLKAIDLVSRTIDHVLINSNLGRKLLFLPAACEERFINRISHTAFRAAADADLTLI